MRKTKNGKYEAVRYEVVDGERKRVFKTFDKLVYALKWQNQIPTKKIVLTDHLLFEDLVTKWQTDYLPHLELSTQVRYRSYVKHFSFLNGRIVEQITASDIDALLVYWKSEEYLSTQHSTRLNYEHEINILKSIFRYYASRVNLSYRMPFLKDHSKMLEVKKGVMASRKKDLSVEELNLFLSELAKITIGTENEPVYYLAKAQYAIFGRVQDAAALHFEDVDLSNRVVIVNKKIVWPRGLGSKPVLKQGSKTNSGKRIPLSDGDVKLFQEWFLRSGIRSGLLFKHREGPYTYRMIESRYNRAFKACGLPFRGTHIIRHAAITELYDDSQDLRLAQEAAGHSDVGTTQRYAKVREKKFKEAKDRIGEKLSARS